MAAVPPARIDEGTPYSRFASGLAIVLYLAFAKLLLDRVTPAPAVV